MEFKQFVKVPFIACILFALGCETAGERLEPSVINQIRPGTTTRAEISRMFGEPTQITRSQEGNTLFYYQRVNIPVYQDPNFTYVAPHQSEGSWRALSVLFGPDDRVIKHLSSDTHPDVGSTRTRFGRHFTQDDLTKIIPRKTTAAEMTKMFGPPMVQKLTLNGERLLVWIYLESYPGQIQSEAVEVIVDENGVVTDFRSTASQPSLRR